MLNNTFGRFFTVTTFGESHGAALGAVIDGVTPNVELDVEAIRRELARRRPGQSALTTRRAEADEVEILSGVFEGRTTGTPLAMLIRNSDQRSGDYQALKGIFRPGHADYGYHKKYGVRDYRGGGRSSGRETVARVAAGAVARQLLARYGVTLCAATVRVGSVCAGRFMAEEIERNPVRAADPEMAAAMAAEIDAARLAGDSVGGVIECRIHGVPAGLGDPVAGRLDAELAHAMLSIGGTKGVEFGAGFAAAGMRGGEHNDAMTPEGFATNHAGGILGGISNGDTILCRIAVKPTASISAEQNTVDVDDNPAVCRVGGRHDPCLCPRMVPVVEAMAALVLIDRIKLLAALLA